MISTHRRRVRSYAIRPIAAIAFLAVLGYVARSIAAPTVHNESPIPVTAISKDTISQLPTGDGGVSEVLQHMDYSGGRLSSINTGFGGSSVLQSIGDTNHTTGMTFDNGTGGPSKLILGNGDPFKSPLIWKRNTELDKNCPWLDLDKSPIISSPPGSHFPGMGDGFIVNPTFGSGTNFPMMPLSGSRASMAVFIIRSKMANVFPAGQSFDHFNINIYGQKFPLSADTITFGLPPTLSNFVPFTIVDGNGVTDAYGGIPSLPQGWLDPNKPTAPYVPPSFFVPVGGQAGKPITVFGPFSGDGKQTHVVFNGDPVPIYSESNWYLTFKLPLDIAGTTNLHIDDGTFHYKNPFSTIGLKLISDDHILQPGERDAFRVRVTGLEDIKSPVEVNIIDLEPGIVAMDGGAEQSFTISPGSGGTVTRDYGLTAIQKGAADIVAWVPQVWSYTPIDWPTRDPYSTGTTESTGTTTVDTTGTTVSTGQTTGNTTGTTTDTGGTTTGATTGSTSTGSTTGSTGQTTGNTTGDTTGTTHRDDGGQRGIVYDGWFEPVQSVWQDDEKFDDKPTKQITKLGPASWNAELKMVVGRPTRLYGLRPDRHKLIEIKGETNRSIEVPVRFRFTLTENGLPPRVLYIEPESHNTVFIDGPKGGIHKFDATLPAYDGIGQTDDTSFTFTNAGAYSIVADLIKPDGTSTGLSVSVTGEAVKTFPPKVYFLPMILNDPKPTPDSKATDRESLYNETASSIGFSAKNRAEQCWTQVPLWFPLKPNDFHTEALDVRDYRGHVKKIDSDYTGDDDKAGKNRADKIAAEIGRILSTQAYQEKATRIVCMLTDDDFKTLITGAAAFTETQKVIFSRQYEGPDTIAHEYVHTTPFLWSVNEMIANFGFNYHNSADQQYADGAEIHVGTEEHRKSHKSAIMGSASDIEKQWITQGTYWHLIGEFMAPHDPPVVCVTGVIKNDNGKLGARLAPLYQQMGEVDLSQGPGDWQIVLKDAAGHIQGGYPFDPHWTLDDCDRPNAYRAIAYRVPYKPETAEIDIVGPGGRVLDSRKIGKRAPEVSITSPIDGGEGKVRAGKVSVSWTGKDPDGGSLLYTVLYSPNNGDDWFVEDFETTDTTFDVPLEHGASQPRVKVIATNGSRSSEAEVGFKAPIIAVH